jgi:integrase
VAPGSPTGEPQQEQQLGPQLRDYALNWADSHIGWGQDTIREATRVEYKRLLVTFAFRYFPVEIRLGELTQSQLQGFLSWLRARPGSHGRLSERSIRNAVTPLRLCLRCAQEEGLIGANVVQALALPRRRTQRVPEGHFLTRIQLTRLLAEIPGQWKPFFDLLASTGLRVSEAIALRWRDLELDGSPHLCVRRSIVNGVVGPPSRATAFAASRSASRWLNSSLSYASTQARKTSSFAGRMVLPSTPTTLATGCWRQR